MFLDPLLGPIFLDFGAQRPPKWRPFRDDLVDFLVILWKVRTGVFPWENTSWRGLEGVSLTQVLMTF